MSDAKAPVQDIFDVNVCSQCLQPFLQSALRDARHAVPCAHVFCIDCLARVQAEQSSASGKSFCRRPGCSQVLANVSEFAVSWAPQRATRLRTELAALFQDQGDAGFPLAPPSPPSAGEAAGAANLCVQHKLPFHGAEVSTHRLLCSECLSAARGMLPVETFEEAISALDSSNAAASVELAKQLCKLAEPTFTPDELRAKTVRWGADETARIKAWEEREVKHVQAVAGECVALVDEVCARRIEVGASILTQRAGLRASLQELDHALSDLPKDPVAALSKKRVVYAERKRLCDLLSEGKIAVPWAWAAREWAELPALSSEFDQKAADNGGVVANAVLTAAKALLTKSLARTPDVSLSGNPRVFSAIELVGFRCVVTRFGLGCCPLFPLTRCPLSHAMPHSIAGRVKGPALDPLGRKCQTDCLRWS